MSDNSRLKHSATFRKRGEKGSYQSQGGQGEFLLSEPHGEDAKAEKCLTRWSKSTVAGGGVEIFSASRISAVGDGSGK